MFQHKNRRRFRTFIQAGIGVIAAFALAAPVHGADAAPAVIPVQGVLTDATGAAVDGEHSIVLTLYDAAEGGTVLYEEDHEAATIDHGAFATYLGSGAPAADVFSLDLFRTHEQVWLEVTIDGEPITPRFQLGSVPYAAIAKRAASAAMCDRAKTADSATSATSATNATNATNAVTAANALKLNGKDASAYEYTAGAGLSLTQGAFAVKPKGITSTMIQDAPSLRGNVTVDGDMTVDGSLKIGAATLDSAEVEGDLVVKQRASMNTLGAGEAAFGTMSVGTATFEESVNFKRDIDVEPGAQVLMGYEVKSCNNALSCSCPAGKRLLSGGAIGHATNIDSALLNPVLSTMPKDETTFGVLCKNGNCGRITIVCARIGS